MSTVAETYQHGVNAALAHYRVKQAGFGESLRRFIVGDPARYFRELRDGTALSGGGMLATSLDPVMRQPELHPVVRGLGTAVNAGLTFGLPALSLYRALQADKDRRGSDAGRVIGMSVGSALGSPLGLLGATGGGSLGAALGETLGRSFNSKSPARQEKTQRPISEEMAAVTERPPS